MSLKLDIRSSYKIIQFLNPTTEFVFMASYGTSYRLTKGYEVIFPFYGSEFTAL